METFRPFYDWKRHIDKLHYQPAILLADHCGRVAMQQGLQPYIGAFKLVIDTILDEYELGPNEKMGNWIEKVCVDHYIRADYPLWYFSKSTEKLNRQEQELGKLYCRLVILAVARRQKTWCELPGLLTQDTIAGEIQSILDEIGEVERTLNVIELFKTSTPRRIAQCKS